MATSNEDSSNNDILTKENPQNKSTKLSRFLQVLSSKNTKKLGSTIVNTEKVPVRDMNASQAPVRVAVPRTNTPLSNALLDVPPIVLMTKLVPSIPIELFEIVAEAIEHATKMPTLILYETRSNRPVDKNIADIAILPAYESWEDGELLPTSFVFQDRFNKNSNSAKFFADIAISSDVASRVYKDILDLRGCRCALPDRNQSIGSASLLFNFLKFNGEGPAFFGNILDTNSQLDALRMVASQQTDVAILESPVIKCNINLPGVDSLHTLASLGPLPPYRIMINKKRPEILGREITDYLKKIHLNPNWIEKLAPFGVLGFGENSESNYAINKVISVANTVPYY